MDIEEKLTKNGIVHFHRANVLCAILRHHDYTHFGLIGLKSGDPHHGNLFVKIGNTRLYRIAKDPTGNTDIDKRWWFSFEGSSPYDFKKTLEELRTVADKFTDLKRDSGLSASARV